jgi:alkylhydroperoxidase family enzyme
VDINAAVGRRNGLTDEQLYDVECFEQSKNFGEREKVALRYAEAMSRTPVEVPDELFEQLKRHFDTPQIVELTSMISLENFRARFNRALHIESDSFCQLPSDHPVSRTVERLSTFEPSRL